MKGKHEHQLMRERDEFTWQHAAEEEELELIGDRGEVDDELGWGGGGGVSWADGPAAGAIVVLRLGRTWSWSLRPMSQYPCRPQMKYLLPSELSEITVSPSRYAFNGCDTRHISKSDFPTSNTSWTGVYMNTAYIYYLTNQPINNYIFIISSTSTTTITPFSKKNKKNYNYYSITYIYIYKYIIYYFI